MVTSISKALMYSTKKKKTSQILFATKSAPLSNDVSSSGIHKMAGLWK
jgi:hypothetical protein